MYLHVFEVTTTDDAAVRIQSFAMVSGGRDVRVRHQVTELPPPDDDADSAWGMGAEDWDEFDLDGD